MFLVYGDMSQYDVKPIFTVTFNHFGCWI